MNKNKAFSLMEVIVSVFILILVLIPSVKLNIQQIKTYSKIKNADSELHFFTSLNNYLKAENIINSHLEFNNYTDFIKTFNNFGNSFQNLKNKNFNLIIDIEKTEDVIYGGKVRITFKDPNGNSSDGYYMWLEPISPTEACDIKGNKWIEF